MSASIPKAAHETVPVVPSFSYAQAAKGKASNATINNNASSTASDISGSGPKRTLSSDRAAAQASPNKTSTKRTASEGRVPENKDSVVGCEVGLGQPNEVVSAVNGDVSCAHDMNEAQKSATMPSSPEYGSTSISTLPKEEDAFSADQNGSSDSTWEKHSQTSQHDIKASGKVDADGQPETDATMKWDEDVAAGPALREAPPPPMNIWQQRREAQAARFKVKQPPTPPVLPGKTASEHGAPNCAHRGTEHGNEVKKQELRKKGKPPLDDKSQSEGLRVSNRDRKAKDSNEDKTSSTVIAPPPPPGDAFSWPTPEDSTVEEKKKPQAQPKPDDGEKDKEPSHKQKASGKKAWTQMDFVPTAVFETHVPQSRRGGRGPSGGRENPPRGRNNVIGPRTADKPGNISTPSTPQTTADDAKPTVGSVATLSVASKSKRASSAGPITSKELRKTGDSSSLDESKEATKGDARGNQPRKGSVDESRKLSAVPIPATPQINIPVGRLSQGESAASIPPTNGPIQGREAELMGAQIDASLPPRSSAKGGRSEGSVRLNENTRETYGNGAPREREERSGRGRGGRNRGGANHAIHTGAATNGNSHANGQGYANQPPFSTPSRSFSNHERTLSQSQVPYFGASPHRSLRSGSRPKYNSGYVPVGGRSPHGPNPGPSHIPNIQTDLANMTYFQSGPQNIMSAIPYNPYEQQVTLWDMVQMQMEYYFSVDNLCKDMFLRKHMDSQGYVFLSVLAGFNRIVALTADTEIIRYVCLNSQKIEFKPGQVWQDGRDRLRVREGWNNFVLPVDQRDPSAQNGGPTPAPPHGYGETNNGLSNRQAASPRSTAANESMDFPYQSLNAMTPSIPQGPPAGPIPNGDNPPQTQPPLSAAVSEFSPAAHSHPSRRFASPDPRPQETKPFTDEEVSHLQILVRQPINSSLPPFSSAASRTFSNGSIDGRNINEELSKYSERQSRPANGDVFESDRSTRSRSPFVVGSPSRRSDLGRSPPVFWMKSKEGASTLESSPNELALESYLDFRRDALTEREQSTQGKPMSNMQNLYNFWSHFLIRNFNAPMYEEFRSLAIDDKAKLNSNMGMQNLMQYYDEALLGQRAILDDNIARHYIDLVKAEDRNQDRSAFKRLRAAWRNGAFNHMNRHKILKVIGSDLKEELDR